MESDDALTGSANFLLQLRIPPDVVNIGSNSDPGVSELIDHVIALADGIYRAAAIGIHRVERFDGKLHADGCSMVDAGGNAFRDLAAVFRKAEFWFGTANQNDLRSAHGGGFVQSSAVVIKGGLAFLGGETREKAAAHERNGLHAMIVEQGA